VSDRPVGCFQAGCIQFPPKLIFAKWRGVSRRAERLVAPEEGGRPIVCRLMSVLPPVCQSCPSTCVQLDPFVTV
jgi:hypothetical protein